MESPWNVIVWCIICFFPVLIYLLRHRRPPNFPPGPPGWPLIGNMFDVGNMPHRNLAALKQKYGPVVGLQLGAIRTMVILTPKAATEFFKNHDLNFVERTIIDTMKVHDFDKNSMSLASYGPSWRALRRLTTLDMLVAKRINESAPIRRRCADQMIAWLEKEARQNGTVELARFTFLTTFNLLGNLMLSSDLLDPNCKEGAEFFEAMMGLMEWSGHPNLSDIFPFLKPFDLQGLRRNMHRDVGNALKIASRFVKKRVEERQKGVQTDRPKDFLDVLLEFEGDPKEGITKISEHTINVFIMEIFLAGSETTSSTTEWVMTELICNSEAMSKVKEELNQVVGPNNRLEETHIDHLPYMQAVVKEAFRLHAPIPLLVPRRAMNDTKFMGYDIPKNTQVLVNAWAIGRDPETWEEPNSFKPERFLGSKIDYKGQHYELIPFGAGRRMCAGVPLAHRMLLLIVGSMLHSFDWELGKKVTREMMDVDRMGITVRKADPLKLTPKCRI